ncbi:Fungal Zn binuclear cluster domain containing protein [Ophiocordyceps camponoti-floridani]|uniref:Fungal Zn binuclear cluster domain containing protein n=1 Tax=Ophiocordyceps camponoti-floridani TaxID=2030778 RepID=A0A8H4VAL5_9HYPO|nr:Fungal Zn binuclear cluster domain containing protein [Ophiocordyceps camponoti-floridani]
MAAVKTPNVPLKLESWEIPKVLSKLEPWEIGCSAKPLFLPNPHALDMSYQYMASPTGQTGIDMSQPGSYHSSFKLPSQDPSVLDVDSKESDGSYEEHKAGDVLRRSYSTPNATQMQQQDTQCQTGATGEKKRNKLGYHRTSIACTHCRRRKIRCIASAEVQNQCVNCIRLKKDCSFYPVDQQPGAESRSRAPAARPAAGSSVASTNSSPAVGNASPGEMSSHHGQDAASGITSGGKNQASGDDFYPPDVKASQYGFANRPPTKWMSDVHSASIPKTENINMSWHTYAAESPMSAQFSPYAQPSTTWVPGNAEPAPHDELVWLDFPPPARSMSLSGESTGSQPPPQYLSVGHGQHYDRRQSALSDMYPHSLGPSVAMAGMEGSGPMVAATLPSNAEPWQPQLLSQGHTPYAKHSVLFDSWQYDKAEGGQQMWLEEQRPPSTTGHAPSEAYYSA